MIAQSPTPTSLSSFESELNQLLEEELNPVLDEPTQPPSASPFELDFNQPITAPPSSLTPQTLLVEDLLNQSPSFQSPSFSSAAPSPSSYTPTPQAKDEPLPELLDSLSLTYPRWGKILYDEFRRIHTEFENGELAIDPIAIGGKRGVSSSLLKHHRASLPPVPDWHDLHHVQRIAWEAAAQAFMTWKASESERETAKRKAAGAKEDPATIRLRQLENARRRDRLMREAKKAQDQDQTQDHSQTQANQANPEPNNIE